MLAFACLEASDQSCLNRVACIQACRQIRDGYADFRRHAISLASNVHEAHFCLDHDIVACSMRVRTRLPVACYRCVDQGGVDLAKCFIVHLVPGNSPSAVDFRKYYWLVLFERSWDIVLNQYITLLDQIVQDLLSGL